MTKLTASKALELSSKNIKKMTGKEFKAFSRKIVEDYGVTPKEATMLMRGENVLEIIAKYERG